MSQPRPTSRRPAPVEPLEEDTTPRWGPQTWLALLVMGGVIAVVLGSGLLIQKALQPIVPAALANCKTSVQIAPREFLGPQPMCITATQKLVATVNTTQGPVVIQLHPEIAPVTVNNFVVLAIHGYYDGLGFWKAEDWVVQSGDPVGNGRGGPGYSLPEEPSNTQWGLASVGMARVPGGPVNGSQFFIQRAPWPGSGPTTVYNRFGTVTSGMPNVQAITTTDTITSVTIKVS